MPRRCAVPLLATLVLVGVAAGPAWAAPIGIGAFGPGTVIESFEGIVVGPNVGPLGPGALIIPTTSPYIFPTGVTLTAPVPSNSSSLVSLDFARGPAGFGLGFNGFIGPADVPLGTAYLAVNNFDEAVPYVEFTFASDQLRVGGFVDAGAVSLGAQNTIRLSVFNAGGVLLESFTKAGVPVASWDSNFIGIEQPGIRFVRFSGDFQVLDALRFEAQVIPEPGALALFGLGVACLVGYRWPRRAAA